MAPGVSELGRTRHWAGWTRLGAAFQEPHHQWSMPPLPLRELLGVRGPQPLPILPPSEGPAAGCSVLRAAPPLSSSDLLHLLSKQNSCPVGWQGKRSDHRKQEPFGLVHVIPGRKLKGSDVAEHAELGVPWAQTPWRPRLPSPALPALQPPVPSSSLSLTEATPLQDTCGSLLSTCGSCPLPTITFDLPSRFQCYAASLPNLRSTDKPPVTLWSRCFIDLKKVTLQPQN